MEYMSCPEAAEKWVFLNGVCRYFVKKIEYLVFQKSVICG